MPAQYFIPTAETSAFDLDLPSGGKVQVRPLSIEDLVGLDILDQMDSLGSIVQEEHVERVKGTKKPTDRPKKKPTKAQLAAEDSKQVKAVMGIMGDKAKWGPLSITIDRVIATAIMQPSVRLAYNEETTFAGEIGQSKTMFIRHSPEDQASRSGDLLWTDQIDLTDKMHIFGKVLPGTDKMASFRKGPAEAVGDVDDQPEDEV